MDQALSFFFTWNVILFCLLLAAVTFAVRRIAESVWPVLTGLRSWRDAALPSFPIALGAVIAVVASKYPYPPGISSVSGRVFFGGVCGFVSAWVYKLVRVGFVAKAGGAELPGPDSDDVG